MPYVPNTLIKIFKICSNFNRNATGSVVRWGLLQAIRVTNKFSSFCENSIHNSMKRQSTPYLLEGVIYTSWQQQIRQKTAICLINFYISQEISDAGKTIKTCKIERLYGLERNKVLQNVPMNENKDLFVAVKSNAFFSSSRLYEVAPVTTSC